MVHLIIISITTVIFGIASLSLISKARNRLSEGSIKSYMGNFAVCLAFIVVFSVWQTVRSIVGSDTFIEEQAHFLTFPEYIFIVFAYIAFIIASFRVTKISEEFGFKEAGEKINEIMKEKSHVTATPPTDKTKKLISKKQKPSKRKSKAPSK
ncbi:hypothetical protein CMO83_00480 [Candidatus Woesearchaeota archaeon]|jgi:hypothetical protein|nr:hypothetical protein [Candidatus Woesearchaeota archaeon]|tara:strand:- start:14063 stop:14518 length:456 start_codon:yes stop_codon:yes gene_type:complete